MTRQDLIIHLAQEYDLDISYMAYLNGGPGSGNFGHAGIPGQRGGSAPGTANSLIQKTDIVKRKMVEIDETEPYDAAAYEAWHEKSKELDEDREKLGRIYSDITNGNLDREYINILDDTGIEGDIKRAIQEHFNTRDRFDEVEQMLNEGESLEDYERGSSDYIRVSKEISSLKKEWQRLVKQMDRTEEKAYDEIGKFELHGHLE